MTLGTHPHDDTIYLLTEGSWGTLIQQGLPTISGKVLKSVRGMAQFLPYVDEIYTGNDTPGLKRMKTVGTPLTAELNGHGAMFHPRSKETLQGIIRMSNIDTRRALAFKQTQLDELEKTTPTRDNTALYHTE